MVSADILLKGLAGVAAVGGATGIGVCYQQKLWIFAEGENLKSMGEKVGLNCTASTGQTEETGVECNIDEKVGLSIKQGSNKDTAKKKGDAQTPAGKIKGYKDGKGFKFVIEDGDITLTGGTPSTNISKLEQFETYEIKEEDGDKKQYLTRKNDAKKEIKLALGLPGEEACDLPADTTAKTCPLTPEKLEKINFDGKAGKLTLSGEGDSTLSLKISKPSADENTIFPHGYKFELQSNKDITLDTSKVIKKGTNTEFKIKVTPASGGPKVLTLEKAWSVSEFAKKVGLECNETLTNGVGQCTLKEGNVNVNNNESGASDTNKKFEKHSKKDNDDKKVKYEIDQESHNQGFKFYTEQEICLKDSNNANGQDKKIEAKGTTSTHVTYEIKKDSDTKWYLTKKTTTIPT